MLITDCRRGDNTEILRLIRKRGWEREWEGEYGVKWAGCELSWTRSIRAADGRGVSTWYLHITCSSFLLYSLYNHKNCGIVADYNCCAYRDFLHLVLVLLSFRLQVLCGHGSIETSSDYWIEAQYLVRGSLFLGLYSSRNWSGGLRSIRH